MLVGKAQRTKAWTLPLNGSVCWPYILPGWPMLQPDCDRNENILLRVFQVQIPVGLWEERDIIWWQIVEADIWWLLTEPTYAGNSREVHFRKPASKSLTSTRGEQWGKGRAKYSSVVMVRLELESHTTIPQKLGNSLENWAGQWCASPFALLHKYLGEWVSLHQTDVLPESGT